MEELEALMRETNKEWGLMWQEGGWGYLTLKSPNLTRVRSNGAYSPLQICLRWTQGRLGSERPTKLIMKYFLQTKTVQRQRCHGNYEQREWLRDFCEVPNWNHEPGSSHRLYTEKDSISPSPHATCLSTPARSCLLTGNHQQFKVVKCYSMQIFNSDESIFSSLTLPDRERI